MSPERAHSFHRARGVTLLEVLIVVALIALLAGGVLFGSGMLGSSRLRAAATLVSSAVRLGIAKANTSGKPTRLVFDLDSNRILLEQADSSRMRRDKSAPAAGAEPASEAEKLAKTESDRILEGPHAPKPRFSRIREFSDQPEGRELGSGVDIKDVQTEHDEQPIDEGRAYLYFWPGGITERAHIRLHRPGTEDALTIEVSGLTGRTKVERGLVDLPEPRSLDEADQGERAEP